MASESVNSSLNRGYPAKDGRVWQQFSYQRNQLISPANDTVAMLFYTARGGQTFTVPVL